MAYKGVCRWLCGVALIFFQIIFSYLRSFLGFTGHQDYALNMPWDNSVNKNAVICADYSHALVEQFPLSETVVWADLIIPSKFYCFQKCSALGCVFQTVFDSMFIQNSLNPAHDIWITQAKCSFKRRCSFICYPFV